VTPDERYFVVRGKLWRMSDPSLAPRDHSRLVNELMDARRAVKESKEEGDAYAEAKAHRRIDDIKRGLGERGPVWWKDGEPDFTRHAVKSSPCAKWHAKLNRSDECSR
jgi:hypothetical protein